MTDMDSSQTMTRRPASKAAHFVVLEYLECLPAVCRALRVGPMPTVHLVDEEDDTDTVGDDRKGGGERRPRM